MCKRKNNLEKIGGYQKEVNFRLDFFARPGLLDKIIAKMPDDLEYMEYKLTEEERQIVGYDDVASVLQISLTELMQSPCQVMYRKEQKNVMIYIHPNFVSIQTYTEDISSNDEIVKNVSAILKMFVDGENLNLENLSCRVTFSALDISEDDKWNVLDRTAFPIMEEANVINGSYVDTHQIGGYFIDLARNLSPNEHGGYDAVITTTSASSDEVIMKEKDEKGLEGLLQNILNESLYEISRCFTE